LRRLWERFLDPVVFTAPMLTDLYTGCGLSLTHIELLTGRPTITISRALLAAGVPPGSCCVNPVVAVLLCAAGARSRGPLPSPVWLS
jgi:hypothetical protein